MTTNARQESSLKSGEQNAAHDVAASMLSIMSSTPPSGSASSSSRSSTSSSNMSSTHQSNSTALEIKHHQIPKLPNAEALSSPMSSSAQLANYPKLALSGLHIPVDQASNTPRIQNELSSLNGHRAESGIGLSIVSAVLGRGFEELSFSQQLHIFWCWIDELSQAQRKYIQEGLKRRIAFHDFCEAEMREEPSTPKVKTNSSSSHSNGSHSNDNANSKDSGSLGSSHSGSSRAISSPAGSNSSNSPPSSSGDSSHKSHNRKTNDEVHHGHNNGDAWATLAAVKIDTASHNASSTQNDAHVINVSGNINNVLSPSDHTSLQETGSQLLSPSKLFESVGTATSGSAFSKVKSKHEIQPLSQDDQQKVVKKRRRSVRPVATNMMCAQCHTTTSPEWRKGPDGQKSLCNACGLRFSKRSRKDYPDDSGVSMSSTSMSPFSSSSSSSSSISIPAPYLLSQTQMPSAAAMAAATTIASIRSSLPSLLVPPLNTLPPISSQLQYQGQQQQQQQQQQQPQTQQPQPQHRQMQPHQQYQLTPQQLVLHQQQFQPRVQPAVSNTSSTLKEELMNSNPAIS